MIYLLPVSGQLDKLLGQVHRSLRVGLEHVPDALRAERNHRFRFLEHSRVGDKDIDRQLPVVEKLPQGIHVSEIAYVTGLSNDLGRGFGKSGLVFKGLASGVQDICTTAKNDDCGSRCLDESFCGRKSDASATARDEDVLSSLIELGAGGRDSIIRRLVDSLGDIGFADLFEGIDN